MRQYQHREPNSRPGGQDVERWTGEGGSPDDGADTRRADDRIREAIADRYSGQQGFDARQISVRVMSGEVSLTGYVPNAEQQRRAEELARSISGVRGVTNNLQIAGSPASAS
jgi:osmotically-inducible protein OsmY